MLQDQEYSPVWTGLKKEQVGTHTEAINMSDSARTPAGALNVTRDIKLARRLSCSKLIQLPELLQNNPAQRLSILMLDIESGTFQHILLQTQPEQQHFPMTQPSALQSAAVLPYLNLLLSPLIHGQPLVQDLLSQLHATESAQPLHPYLPSTTAQPEHPSQHAS